MAFAREKIGMCRSREAREYKYRLMPAVRELESIGFLKPVQANECFEKMDGVYRVNFWEGESRRRKKRVGGKNARVCQVVRARQGERKKLIEIERPLVSENICPELSKQLVERALPVAPLVLSDGYRRTRVGGGPMHEAYREKLLQWQIGRTKNKSVL